LHWLNENSGAIQASATTVLVVLTAAYAWLVRKQAKAADLQVREVAKSSRTQAMIQVMLFLQAEYVREARRVVRGMTPREDWEKHWSQDQIEAVGIVCSSFDAIANLVDHGLLDDELLTTTWGVTLVRCFSVCEPYIRSLREDQSGPTFWRSFEQAARRAERRADAP
jgi:hypothetical protein